MTRLCLVLLQLAIGWHFLYEGWWKIQQHDAWSSKGYIRNATGPFAPAVRWSAGDPDVAWQDGHFVNADHSQDFLARFRVEPFDPKEDPTQRKPHTHMPPALAKEWDDYFQKFVGHYQLDDTRKAQAERDFIAAKNETVEWLTRGTKKIKPSHLSGSAAELPRTVAQRIEEYEAKLQEVRDLENEGATLGAKLAPKVRKARDEANAIKQSLVADLDEQTAKMKAKLRALLDYDEKRMDRVADAADAKPAAWGRIATIDNVVKYGLFAVGACLMLGLFTRLASVAGALFLLAFYLAMPPLPGLTETAAAKGHYLFVNENIIEALALFTIAVSHPARRYGLDAWLGLAFRGLGCGRRDAEPGDTVR